LANLLLNTQIQGENEKSRVHYRAREGGKSATASGHRVIGPSGDRKAKGAFCSSQMANIDRLAATAKPGLLFFDHPMARSPDGPIARRDVF